MPLEVKKQERETSQSLVRRFKKRIQLSGILNSARKIRFYQPAKSRGMKKRAALRREEIKKEYQKLEKMGMIKDKKPRRR